MILGALALLAPAVARSAGPEKLAVETIVIDTATGPHPFHVEIAADDASRALGLMYRTHLARDAGMLFDFHEPVMTSFWMKNTPLPLDMLFVREDGTVSSVAQNAIPYSTAQISSVEPIRAVIEVNAGVAEALGIHPGAIVHASAFHNAGKT